MIIDVVLIKFVPYVLRWSLLYILKLKKLNLGFLRDNNLVIYNSEFDFNEIKKCIKLINIIFVQKGK